VRQPSARSLVRRLAPGSREVRAGGADRTVAAGRAPLGPPADSRHNPPSMDTNGPRADTQAAGTTPAGHSATAAPAAEAPAEHAAPAAEPAEHSATAAHAAPTAAHGAAEAPTAPAAERDEHSPAGHAATAEHAAEPAAEHAERNVGSNRKHLAIVLVVALVTLGVDIVAAMASGSLALVADAAHRVTDVVGIAIAFGAATIAARPATHNRSFGYHRAEVIAACVNAGLLVALGGFIAVEAIARIEKPEAPDPGPMLLAAVIGLAGSGTAALVMRSEHEGFAARGAFLDVLGDAVGSIAAIIAGLLVIATGWEYADPLASLAVVALVVPRALILLRDAVNVLMESVPTGLSLPAVRTRILGVPGVVAVHDLHAWQITAGLPMITAHVVTADGVDHHALLREIDDCLAEDFDLDHSTIQVEHISRPVESDAHA
jgi:cobalt-zinc-cadmium efflux system protein